MVLDVPGGEAQAAEVAEAERRCKKELRALAKCQREQAKKGKAAKGGAAKGTLASAEEDAFFDRLVEGPTTAVDEQMGKMASAIAGFLPPRTPAARVVRMLQNLLKVKLCSQMK